MSNYCHFFYRPAVLTLAALFLSFNSGCKPSEQRQAQKQAAIEQMVDTTFDQIAQLQAEQKFTEAERLITNSLANRNFLNFRERLMLLKTEHFLQQGGSAAAEEFILGVLPREPANIREALNALFAHYTGAKEFDKIIALSGRILSAKFTLPEEMTDRILSQQLAAAIELDDAALQKAAVDSIIATVKESPRAIAIIEPQMTALIRKKNYPAAMELATHLQNAGAGDDNYKNLAVIISMQCVVDAQNWSQLKPVFTNCLQQLPDGELAKLMRYVFVNLSKAKMNDLLKECAQAGIAGAVGKPKSTDYAAGKWVEVCFAEDKQSLPGNISALLKTSVSPNQSGSIFDRFFYDVAADKDSVKALCKIGPELIAQCTDDNIANSLKVKILDGAFIIEDYDLAVAMLEQGIPGKDKAWHDMSLPKVKAHRAQSQQKPRDAVKYYREFMECWTNSDKEEEFDPTSGIAYSKEWILARNASRIAEILQSIPDEAEAAKARDEARNYFKTAIEKAATDEAALKLVTEEAAKLN